MLAPPSCHSYPMSTNQLFEHFNMLLTLPDIEFTVNKVCQFMANPLDTHLEDVKCMLRYLKGSMHYGLLLRPALPTSLFTLHAYCDDDWASDPDDRRSTSFSCIFFGSNLVSWCSKKSL